MISWHPDWPGFGARGSLALPLPAAQFRGLERRLRVEGMDLALKDEFHVTLLDKELGARAQQPAPGGTLAARLPSLFAALDWRWRRSGARWLLFEAKDGVEAHTVIELLEMPALNDFRRDFGRLLGEPVPATPAHVTLYMHNTAIGIGLSSQAEFERLRLRPI